MSKYCPMCDEYTNCTDNCTNCIEESKCYTLFAWFSDDEGGHGVCKREAFVPKNGRRVKIGNFDTLAELTTLLMAENADSPREFAAQEAVAMMNALLAQEFDA